MACSIGNHVFWVLPHLFLGTIIGVLVAWVVWRGIPALRRNIRRCLTLRLPF